MSELMIVKRTGDLVEFDTERIENAIKKAFKSVGDTTSPEAIRKIVEDIYEEVRTRFVEFYPNVENVQDVVEKHLLKYGHLDVAKSYILYRAERQQAREKQQELDIEKAQLGKLTIIKRDGRKALFDQKKIRKCLMRAIGENQDDVDIDLIMKETIKAIYDGVDTRGLEMATILATVSFIEKDPGYNVAASKLFMQKLRKEVIQKSISQENLEENYKESFKNSIKHAVDLNLLDKKMLDFDLDRLADAINIHRDDKIQYIGIQTLYERYLLKDDDKNRLELLQSFWMRVSMGLSLDEDDKEKRAIEFYELLSNFRYIPSTPTLFNAGGNHSQLSSCYLTTISDDLKHIFKCIGDNARLSKWAGGIGNDWTNIRATNALIKSTQAESQGVVPFLKIASDVTAAISRTGKRRGGTCAYLETWHLDIEDFLDLRKNTGDERRRTHDMNTANWIPDLFMKRVIDNQDWTLFSPDEVEDLHHLYGLAFEQKYTEYEKMASDGKIASFKVIPAKQLWRKMLSMLFETGHPWLTFKDPCNIRSPQDHIGVVHSSNLCTEITLNTSNDETAVCNLGSVNLGEHIVEGKLDQTLLGTTVQTALRMLDNVIDLNFYPTDEAKNSNAQHRPVGLGVMGLQDAIFKQNLSFDQKEALEFADLSMEVISYNAILGSSILSKERGPYPSYKGSKWSKGIFPIDTIDLLEKERQMRINVDRTSRLDWTKVREHVKEHGMRNSNTMAIAPTASISTIVGCYPCIEPIYKNIYVKSNISGEFTVVNEYLVEDLKKLNLWNSEMLDQIKYYDGNLNMIASIPEEIKTKHKEAFDIDPLWAIDMTAARSKWIDQSQSHNVFMKGTSGKLLEQIYVYAWGKGLKTTYYLRTLGATQIEKSTLDTKYGFTQKREYESMDKQSDEPIVSNADINPAIESPAESVVDEGPIKPITAAAISASLAAAQNEPNGMHNGHAQEPVSTASSASDSSAAESLLKKYSFSNAPKNPLEPKDDGPKLCRIADPECEACQ